MKTQQTGLCVAICSAVLSTLTGCAVGEAETANMAYVGKLFTLDLVTHESWIGPSCVIPEEDLQGCKIELEQAPGSVTLEGSLLIWTPSTGELGYHELTVRFSPECQGVLDVIQEQYQVYVAGEDEYKHFEEDVHDLEKGSTYLGKASVELCR